MPKVVTGVKIYSYRADGLHILTPRRPGTTRPHDEVIPYVTLTERQRKAQRRLDAVRRAAANREIQKRIVK